MPKPPAEPALPGPPARPAGAMAFARAVAASGAALAVTDHTGRVTWANEALRQLVGGASAAGGLPACDGGRALTAAIVAVSDAGRPWEGELPLVAPDGREVTVHATLTPLPGEGHPEDGVIAVLQDVSAEAQERMRIRHEALHDGLTGLPNRALFFARLQEALARARRAGGMVAVHFLDLDRFKLINDTYGHPVGDALLQAIGARLARSTRETDTIGRLSGDEFAVVQADLHSTDEAGSLARKLLELMAQPFEVAGLTLNVSISVGVALFPHDGADAAQLMRDADLALYQAKRMGRNALRFYSPALDEAVRRRQVLEAGLRAAAAGQTFALALEPWVGLPQGSKLGWHARLRWPGSLGDLATPEEIAAVAADCALEHDIGAWAIGAACGRLGAEAPAGRPARRASVTLFPGQLSPLRADALVATCRAELAAAGVVPAQLRLVVPSAALTRYGEAAARTLGRLHALGIGLAVDGCGREALAPMAIADLPLEALCIDATIVDRASVERGSAAIMHAAIALGRGLGIKVVAADVTSAAAAAFAFAAGCDEAFGPYYASPA